MHVLQIRFNLYSVAVVVCECVFFTNMASIPNVDYWLLEKQCSMTLGLPVFHILDMKTSSSLECQKHKELRVFCYYNKHMKLKFVLVSLYCWICPYHKQKVCPYHLRVWKYVAKPYHLRSFRAFVLVYKHSNIIYEGKEKQSNKWLLKYLMSEHVILWAKMLMVVST